MPISLNSNFMKYGLPFIIFVIGGSVGLSEFTKLRYKYRRQKEVSKREAIMLGLDGNQKPMMTLESEYEKLKTMDFDNWENKRIPRPWEPEEGENQTK